MNDFLEQRIQLIFQEKLDKIVFSVSNPTKYISFSDIDKMFINGYSTKGDNRGIGLTRVKELIVKYSAVINVFNTNPCSNENWICFQIEVSKLKRTYPKKIHLK